MSSTRTTGRPDVGTDPTQGTVQVDVWEDVHRYAAPDAPFPLIRITVEHLPRHDRAPAPRWLAWIGGPLPDDLLALWHLDGGRFTIEHGFRFAKQALGWTTVRPQATEATDRWTWLLVLGYWELWLARAVVADHRLPGERPAPPGDPTTDQADDPATPSPDGGRNAQLSSPAPAPRFTISPP